MIRRIVIENYMSHARSVFELAPGLTVICGANNCGKSAVVSAIETLCFNPPGDFMVRHGCDEARVTVETDDGHTLGWRRRKGVVSYQIDDREVHRLGRGGVPEDLHQHLRMDRVTTERGAFDLHLGKQKTPIFLIDDDAGAAAFFSSASDAQRLLELQRLHKQKEREHRTLERQLRSDCERLDAELEALAPLDELSSHIDAIEVEHQRLTGAVKDEQALSLLTEKLRQHAARAQRDAARTAALGGLRPPPQLQDESPLREHIERLESGLTRRALREDQREALTALQPPPVLRETGDLRQLIDRMQAAEARRGHCEARRSALDALAPPPQPSDPAPLVELIQRFDRAEHRRIRAAAKLDELAAQLRRARKQITDWAAENPLCPTCGAATDAERLLDAEGAHSHA